MNQPPRRALLLLGIAWLLATVAGLFLLMGYETAPGSAAATRAHWPADSRLILDPGSATLLMFAHPRCPCTRASIDELSHLMTHCQGRARAHVLFFKPDGAGADWDQTDLWRSAEAIPGVQVAWDIGGVEARRFGAKTSGQVVGFSPDGCCLYSGGITGSRGHRGDNAGRDAVQAILGGQKRAAAGFPVFGCALFDSATCEPQDSPCQCQDRTTP